MVKLISFADKKKKGKASSSGSSSRISVDKIYQVMDRLKSQKDSTARNYLSIWRHFNTFLIRLDRRPNSWKERTAFFCSYLIQKGRTQSSTIASYISAIKTTLKNDGYI